MSRSTGRKRIWFQHSQEQKIKKETQKITENSSTNEN